MRDQHSRTQRELILEQFRTINTWKRGSQRAPHKPLLILLALARVSRGEPREILYPEVDKTLRPLLLEFGPPRKSVHPEYPFWRLQNDGIWVVRDAENLRHRQAKDDPLKSELMHCKTPGGFSPKIDTAFRKDPSLLVETVGMMLDAHFPTTIHEDILAEVGMQLPALVMQKKPRDPHFRERVLRSYERKCAICDLDVRLGQQTLALEAAHIKWHQAGGPDIETNGLALCTLHHKMFDRGAFTLTQDRRIAVSQDACGNSGFEDTLLRYHGQRIRKPQCQEYLAGEKFISWHEKEVFRGPSRS